MTAFSLGGRTGKPVTENFPKLEKQTTAPSMTTFGSGFVRRDVVAFAKELARFGLVHGIPSLQNIQSDIERKQLQLETQAKKQTTISASFS